ncbi:type II toxin-antitoxin system RelE/ParE family toxin [Cedecea colo]|uniref:Killer protein n=1 Tax=Cedecea colo TaxID=2552946 RepID=A0ABX0VPE8_9ENTR|nr:type II toxin-antitoxin system RelE/ParE family toxin [Cedecea colo]NIY48879.1 Killer protein [Cedecea colo]
MIRSFKHKGLKNLFLKNQTQGLSWEHVPRIRSRLAIINAAGKIEDIDLPGYRLHALAGDKADLWSVAVTGNWRITFEFYQGDAWILNYEDYH